MCNHLLSDMIKSVFFFFKQFDSSSIHYSEPVFMQDGISDVAETIDFRIFAHFNLQPPDFFRGMRERISMKMFSYSISS